MIYDYVIKSHQPRTKIKEKHVYRIYVLHQSLIINLISPRKIDKGIE